MYIAKLAFKSLYYVELAPYLKFCFKTVCRKTFEIKSNDACDRDCINVFNRLPNVCV